MKPLSFFFYFVDMSLSKGESHSVSQISELQGSRESSWKEATSSNVRMVGISLRMVPWTG